MQYLFNRYWCNEIIFSVSLTAAMNRPDEFLNTSKAATTM